MAKVSFKLNPISNIFLSVPSSYAHAGNTNTQTVFSAAAGSLSLEQATTKWNNSEFLDSIFALVIQNKDGETVILKRDQHDIRFQYKNLRVCVAFEDSLEFAYEVKAILCKDKSGLEITDSKIRYMNSGAIYDFAHGLKIFAKPEKKITKVEIQAEDKAFELQVKKSKHLGM